MAFSDFIIYVDESGSPVLSADQEDFAVFVLVFMIVEKTQYADKLVPLVQKLKFDFVGHDQIILHERDIRRQSGSFAFLQVSETLRDTFLSRINDVVTEAPISVACAVIDKRELGRRYATPWDPYDLALNFCMEKAAKTLHSRKQQGRKVHVVFEARGKKEDAHLELEFRRIASGTPKLGNPLKLMTEMEWEPIFVDKKANSTGLQIADLLARPVGLGHLRPGQANRALEVIESKILYPGPKVFP
ncbi:MAG: DUF3800 domain-containing protein [Pseudorhodobacter sp.]|nr:DUF3800 domain-containing protein [Pseudorhodobacter sp.]